MISKKIYPFQDGLFLLGLALLEGAFLFILMLSKRIIANHDAFLYFASQYYFLNEAVTSGEIPRWLPFVMQGSTANWWYLLQGSLLQLPLLQVGRFLKGIDFLTVFYMNLWVDHLFLITGTWLLSRRFLSASATAFVTLTVVGSSIWVMQPWFNFRFTYALPMILYLLHQFLEKQQWRYLFLASHLLIFQFVGNPPYVLPVILLAVFLYFFFYTLLNVRKIRPILAFMIGKKPWMAILIFGSVLASSFWISSWLNLMDHIVIYSIGRNPDGSTSLGVFLNHGEKQFPAKWLEFFLGFSPRLDQTLYMGILSLVCLLVAAFHLQRKHLHFLFASMVLLLFSMRTPVATFFYYTWPLMKFYRHIGYVISFVKLFLCFIAGVGFETIFNQPLRDRPSRSLIILLLLLLCSILIGIVHHPKGIPSLIRLIACQEPTSLFRPLLQENFLASSLRRTAQISLLAAIALGIWTTGRLGRCRPLFIALMLLLHTLDLYGYKLADAWSKTATLTSEQRELTQFQPMPYSVRRTPLLKSNDLRVRHFLQLPLFGGIAIFVQSFVFHDEPGSSFQTVYWEKPLDRFMKAYWGQAPETTNRPPAGFIAGHGLIFPLQHPAAGKAAGITKDKIQFFSRAYQVSSETQLTRLITNPAYSGDLLFVSPRENEKRSAPSEWTGAQPLSSNDRLELSYQIERFNSNHLEIRVEVPNEKPAWLFYSDVWNPHWKATLQGEPTPVFRANLAYKAVALHPGPNRVRFSFESGAQWIYCYFAVQAIFWLVLLGSLIGKIFLERKPL